MATEAFELLLDTATRCKANAKGLPRQEVVSEYWSGVGFKIVDKLLVVPLQEIGEILQCPRLSTVPGVVKWLRGVANLRGMLLPITDLEGFLSGDILKIGRKNRVLVVSQDDKLAGLLIDQVLGLQRFMTNLEAPIDETIDDYLKPYIKGSFKDDDEKVWHIFSLRAVMASQKFSQVGL